MRNLLWICLLSPVLATPAFGWGCDGHQIVALVARARLTPAASAAVDAMLKANPVDPALVPFCKDRDPDPMADIASWADDIRTKIRNNPWHFIDIPRSVTTVGPLDQWCPAIGPPAVEGKQQSGCITNVIAAQLATLRDKSAAPSDRADALRYVIHFVGDIHQPLHTMDDAGGNCSPVRFHGDERATNLHSLWDTRLIEDQETTEKATTQSLAASLNSKFAPKFASLRGAPVADAVSWAWESHNLAVAFSYGDLEPKIPVAEGEIVCATERQQVQALNIVIGADYVAQTRPVLDEQLATAGFRLAYLLNDMFK